MTRPAIALLAVFILLAVPTLEKTTHQIAWAVSACGKC